MNDRPRIESPICKTRCRPWCSLPIPHLATWKICWLPPKSVLQVFLLDCEVAIYPWSVVYFDPGDDMGAAICWTNECCGMWLHDDGWQMVKYGRPNFAKDIGSLPGITKTHWGLVKCGTTRNAVNIGPRNDDDLEVHCVTFHRMMKMIILRFILTRPKIDTRRKPSRVWMRCQNQRCFCSRKKAKTSTLEWWLVMMKTWKISKMASPGWQCPTAMLL